MRLLIVGTLDGHIAAAGKIALARGAKVAHADDIDAALHALRARPGRRPGHGRRQARHRAAWSTR